MLSQIALVVDDRDHGGFQARDRGGRHLQDLAARAGDVEICRLLLAAGAEVDAGDSDNSTALGIAAMWGKEDMVAFLIERGADVSYHDPHIPVAPSMRSWPDLPRMESTQLNADMLQNIDAAIVITDQEPAFFFRIYLSPIVSKICSRTVQEEAPILA